MAIDFDKLRRVTAERKQRNRRVFADVERCETWDELANIAARNDIHVDELVRFIAEVFGYVKVEDVL